MTDSKWPPTELSPLFKERNFGQWPSFFSAKALPRLIFSLTLTATEANTKAGALFYSKQKKLSVTVHSALFHGTDLRFTSQNSNVCYNKAIVYFLSVENLLIWIQQMLKTKKNDFKLSKSLAKFRRSHQVYAKVCRKNCGGRLFIIGFCRLSFYY